MEDITGLGEVATAVTGVINNVIDKISDAVGVVYNDSDYKMRKEAKKELINEIVHNKNYNEYSKSYLISNLNKEIKNYENQRAIIQKAIMDVDDDTNIYLVDDDWLNFFFDKAKNVSSEEMQNIWAKLLSEEFNRPRSIPKSLIQIIYIMDYKTANVFDSVCKFVLEIDSDDKYVPFIDFTNFQNELKEYDITFDTINELEKYGLIYFSPECVYCTTGIKHNVNVELDECTIVLKPDNQESIENGNILLSNDGKALYRCIISVKSKLLIKMIRSICKEYIL